MLSMLLLFLLPWCFHAYILSCGEIEQELFVCFFLIGGEYVACLIETCANAMILQKHNVVGPPAVVLTILNIVLKVTHLYLEWSGSICFEQFKSKTIEVFF